MNELVSLVSAKTGLSPEHAQIAVETVLGFLKQRLPEPIASSLDSIASGGQGGGAAPGLDGIMGQAAGAFGGLFGSKE